MPFPPFTSTLASAPAQPMVLLSPVTSISVPDDSSWAESAPTPNQSPAIVLRVRLDLDRVAGGALAREPTERESPDGRPARTTCELERQADGCAWERRQRHPGRVRRRSRFGRAVDADRRGDGRQRGEERDGLRPSTRDGELDRGAGARVAVDGVDRVPERTEAGQARAVVAVACGVDREDVRRRAERRAVRELRRTAVGRGRRRRDCGAGRVRR